MYRDTTGGHKNLIIGCIYALEYINKQSSKISALMGDFNNDLIKYASETNTGKYYDLLCFRLLIILPSKVTSKTATLIGNIFINDISCRSQGRNITSSISDHYFQVCQTDTSGSSKHLERGTSIILISANLTKNY